MLMILQKFGGLLKKRWVDEIVVITISNALKLLYDLRFQSNRLKNRRHAIQIMDLACDQKMGVLKARYVDPFPPDCKN